MIERIQSKSSLICQELTWIFFKNEKKAQADNKNERDRQRNPVEQRYNQYATFLPGTL